MAEKEKEQEQISYEEQLIQAFMALKGKPLPKNDEKFVGDIPRIMPDRFLKK